MDKKDKNGVTQKKLGQFEINGQAHSKYHIA